MGLPIAFIDDETVHIEYYINALRSVGYGSKYFKSPDSCLTAIADGEQFRLFITDMMMPSIGKYSAINTREFLITGLFFVKDIRKNDRETPIIVFTNLNIESIIVEVRTEVEIEPNVFFVRKIDYPPHLLAEAVSALLGGKNPFSKRRKILQRFWDSLILEPNLNGIGIDIKKLIR